MSGTASILLPDHDLSSLHALPPHPPVSPPSPHAAGRCWRCLPCQSITSTLPGKCGQQRQREAKQTHQLTSTQPLMRPKVGGGVRAACVVRAAVHTLAGTQGPNTPIQMATRRDSGELPLACQSVRTRRIQISESRSNRRLQPAKAPQSADSEPASQPLCLTGSGPSSARHTRDRVTRLPPRVRDQYSTMSDSLNDRRSD